MFHLITNQTEARRAHSALRRAFQRGAEQAVQTLSWPGGQIHDATLLVRRDLDLWAYFSDAPDRRGLLLCWFGVGKPSWQTSIEINIPVRRTLHCYAQLVADAQGDICLAHKGGLGGGKFTVAPGPFGDLIDGFEREHVQDGSHEREYYVLGRLARPAQLLPQLSEFVHQAENIRELRRDERKFNAALVCLGGTVRNGKAIGGNEYTGERSGGGAYWVKRKVRFERIHADVQRALAEELHSRALRCGDRRQKHGLGPDLYVRDRNGHMTLLFEIKVGQDSQSTFTALGQLLVYSSGEQPPPVATLVTRGLPRSHQFKAALDAQKIKVLRYTIDTRRRVTFYDLDSVLHE
jgi:hypothetical protein